MKIRRMTRRMVLSGMLAVAGLAALLLWLGGRTTSGAIAGHVQPLLRRDFEVSVSAAGFTDLENKITLSSPASGVVADRPRPEGSTVSEGESLVSIMGALDEFRVRAPFPAMIVRVGDPIQKGAMIHEGDFLMEIGRSGSQIVRCDLDPVDLSLVAPGLRAEISSDAAPGKKFRGTVTSVSASVRNTAEGIKVPVEIRLMDWVAVPTGTRVDVRIISAPKRNVYVVPAQAIALNSPQPVVYILRKGRAVKIPVQTRMSNGAEVEVAFRAPIQTDDQLIVSHAGGLADGRPVTIER